MKKTILMTIGTLVLAAPLCAQADHERHATRTLTDNDDGQVEVWRRGEEIRTGVTASTIRQPLVHALFVGSGWTTSAKEAVVAQLSRTAVPDGVQPLSMTGSDEIAAPATLNDLQVQSLLDGLASPDPHVVYVLFLGSGVRSTLGASHAGEDYDSYHSHFHAHDANVRYVVVPWSDVAAEAAAKSVLRAIINPQ